MNQARATLRVTPHSWHGKLYLMWKRLGGDGKKYGYRENLCHYVRVVLFWAPLSWYLRAHPKRTPWLRPCVVGAVLVTVATLTAATLIWTATAIVAWMVAGAMLVVFVLLLLLGCWCDRHSKMLEAFFTRVGDGILAAFEATLVPVAKGIAWFFVKTRLFWVLALLATPVVLIVVASATWPVWALRVLLSLIGFVVVALVLWGLVMAVLSMISNVLSPAWHNHCNCRDDKINSRPPRPRKEEKDKGDSFFSTMWEYLVARKHKACPFIDIEQ